MPAIYDQPTATAKGQLPPGTVEDGGGLTCFSYPQFVVKEIDSGGPGGDVSITIVPTAAATRGACSAAPEPGQIVVKTDGQSFTGVKGNFIVLQATDPNGASAFAVLDRRTGKPRYADGLLQLKADDGISFIADENDALHLRYTRGINGSCSLPKGGPACFAQIAHEHHLAASVTMDRHAFELCTSIYQSLKTPLDDPSIVTYAADIIVPRSGHPQVISRTTPTCYPLP